MKIDISSQIFDFIISLQEYKSEEYETPYIVKLANEDNGIMNIGIEHSKNPNDNNYVIIESLFEEFIDKYETNLVAMVENFKPQIESKEIMIQKYGESGFLTWLADKYNVKCVCPEPSSQDAMNFVIKKWNFEKKDVLLWVFLNILLHILKVKKVNIIDNADKILNQIESVGKTIGIEQSSDEYLLYFQNKLNEITGNNFIIKNKENLIHQEWNIEEINDLQSPFIKKTILSDIGTAFNKARDIYLVLAQLQAFEDGNSVFSVFGKNHVVCQEPVLKEFLKKKTSNLYN